MKSFLVYSCSFPNGSLTILHIFIISALKYNYILVDLKVQVYIKAENGQIVINNCNLQVIQALSKLFCHLEHLCENFCVISFLIKTLQTATVLRSAPFNPLKNFHLHNTFLSVEERELKKDKRREMFTKNYTLGSYIQRVVKRAGLSTSAFARTN